MRGMTHRVHMFYRNEDELLTRIDKKEKFRELNRIVAEMEANGTLPTQSVQSGKRTPIRKIVRR